MRSGAVIAIGITCVVGSLFSIVQPYEGPPTVSAPEACALVPFEDPATQLSGFRDRKGRKIRIAPHFDFAGDFDASGLAPVHDAAGWAYLKCDGQSFPVIAFDNGPDYFNNGRARFAQDDKYGYVDRRGHIAIPARFDWAEPFCHGRARVGFQCASKVEGEHTSVTCASYEWIDVKGTKLKQSGGSGAEACQ